MTCKNCGKTIIDGEDYIGVREKNFCSMNCAKEYYLNNPKEAVDYFVNENAQTYSNEDENPYV